MRGMLEASVPTLREIQERDEGDEGEEEVRGGIHFDAITTVSSSGEPVLGYQSFGDGDSPSFPHWCLYSQNYFQQHCTDRIIN